MDDPPKSIGSKKICIDVMSKTQKLPKSWFFTIFQANVAFLSNDMCPNMLTYVFTSNKQNK